MGRCRSLRSSCLAERPALKGYPVDKGSRKQIIWTQRAGLHGNQRVGCSPRSPRPPAAGAMLRLAGRQIIRAGAENGTWSHADPTARRTIAAGRGSAFHLVVTQDGLADLVSVPGYCCKPDGPATPRLPQKLQGHQRRYHGDRLLSGRETQAVSLVVFLSHTSGGMAAANRYGLRRGGSDAGGRQMGAAYWSAERRYRASMPWVSRRVALVVVDKVPLRGTAAQSALVSAVRYGKASTVAGRIQRAR